MNSRERCEYYKQGSSEGGWSAIATEYEKTSRFDWGEVIIVTLCYWQMGAQKVVWSQNRAPNTGITHERADELKCMFIKR